MFLCLLAAPSSAQANERALAIANGVWPTACVARVVEEPLHDAGPGVVAQADHRECVIRLRPGWAASVTFDRLCSVIVHEKGHLAGFREEGGPDWGVHSADPSSNMHVTSPHHPACGPTHVESHQRELAAQHAETLRRQGERRAMLLVRIRDVRAALRHHRRACPRYRGAKRRRCAKRQRKLTFHLATLRRHYSGPSQ